MRKRVISLVLAVAMMFTLAVPAFAADEFYAYFEAEDSTGLIYALDYAANHSAMKVDIHIVAEFHMPNSTKDVIIPANAVLYIDAFSGGVGGYFWMHQGKLINNGVIRLLGVLNYNNNITNNGDIYVYPGSKIEGRPIEGLPGIIDLRGNYLIVYHLNGGNFDGDTDDLMILVSADDVDTTIVEDMIAGREGYIFGGWLYNGEVFERFGETVSELEDLFTGEDSELKALNLFALWNPENTQETYTVTYKPGAHGTWADEVYEGLEFGTGTPGHECDPDSEISEADAELWYFDRWMPKIADIVTEDAEYEAVWAEYYTVIYDPGAHGTWDADTETHTKQKFDEGLPQFNDGDLPENHEAGWVLTGWLPVYDGDDDIYEPVYSLEGETVAGNVTYIAQWEYAGAEGFEYTAYHYLGDTNILLAPPYVLTLETTSNEVTFYAMSFKFLQTDKFSETLTWPDNEAEFRYYYAPYNPNGPEVPGDPYDPDDPYYDFYVKIISKDQKKVDDGKVLTCPEYDEEKAFNNPDIFKDVNDNYIEGFEGIDLIISAVVTGSLDKVGTTSNTIDIEQTKITIIYNDESIDITSLFTYFGSVYVDDVLIFNGAIFYKEGTLEITKAPDKPGDKPTGGGGGGGTPASPAPTPSPTPTPEEPAPTPAEIPDTTPLPLGGQFVADHIQYINGYPDGSVRPDANITRAEVSAILFRLLADTAKKNKLTSIFDDVTDDAWYAQSVKYLSSIGNIKGYPEGDFRPDNPITRAEFATLISGFDNLEPSEGSIFSDTDGHWAEAYINSAAEKGWVSGYPDGSFQPEQFMTRAEVVTVINRMLLRSIEAEDVPDWAPYYTDLEESHWAYTQMIEASLGHEFERKPDGDGVNEIWTSELDFIKVLES